MGPTAQERLGELCDRLDRARTEFMEADATHKAATIRLHKAEAAVRQARDEYLAAVDA